MVKTSNEGILTECLISYGALKASQKACPEDFLKILFLAESYQAGDDLRKARDSYSPAIWRGVASAELNRRLADLDRFMGVIARQRSIQWGLSK